MKKLFENKKLNHTIWSTFTQHCQAFWKLLFSWGIPPHTVKCEIYRAFSWIALTHINIVRYRAYSWVKSVTVHSREVSAPDWHPASLGLIPPQLPPSPQCCWKEHRPGEHEAGICYSTRRHWGMNIVLSCYIHMYKCKLCQWNITKIK